jgi:hypothetical protein
MYVLEHGDSGSITQTIEMMSLRWVLLLLQTWEQGATGEPVIITIMETMGVTF